MANKRYLKDYSRKEIQTFVSTYCYCPLYDNLEECARDHELSIQMAKKFIYTAISKCIVEDDVVGILFGKSYLSATRHSYLDGIHAAPQSCYRKYSETIEIALMYAASPLRKSDFCSKNAMTKAIFDQTLIRAIVENLISDDIVTDLQNKALSFAADTEKVKQFFEKLWKQRKENT